LLACSSARSTDSTEIQRVGAYVQRHSGPQLDAVIGYRYAATHLGDEWLILDLAVRGQLGATGRIERTNVFVIAPNGTRIPLATQRELANAYSELRPVLRQVAIGADPVDTFPASLERTPLQLFVEPGRGITFDTITLNDRRVAAGRIFFRVPGGVQAGPWTFVIELEESEVRVPFELRGAVR
jgi:hypothetical protein